MLKELIEHYTKGNKAQFAKMLGVSAQTISAWVARNTFDAELLYAKCSGINSRWLLTGQGSMLSSDDGAGSPTAAPQQQPSQEGQTPSFSAQQHALINRMLDMSQEIGRLTAENAHLTADLSRLTADNARLTADVSRLAADNARLTAQLSHTSQFSHNSHNSQSE